MGTTRFASMKYFVLIDHLIDSLFRYSHELAYHEDEFEYEDEEEEEKLEGPQETENSTETEHSAATEPSGAREESTEYRGTAEQKVYTRRSEKGGSENVKDGASQPRETEEVGQTDTTESVPTSETEKTGEVADSEENAVSETETEKQIVTESVAVEDSKADDTLKISCGTEAQLQKENLCENSDNVRETDIVADIGDGS